MSSAATFTSPSPSITKALPTPFASWACSSRSSRYPLCRPMNAETPTLLYIDDDKALARLVDRGLTRLGLKVVHAENGDEGLNRLAQGGIDVVALDQYMPGLDGLETLERILAIPNGPPVVFVTASQDCAIAVTALEAGAAGY